MTSCPSPRHPRRRGAPTPAMTLGTLKKNLNAEQTIQVVKAARIKYDLGTAAVCQAAGLPCSTVKRWETRLDAGLLPVQPPGPQPVIPVDWATLDAQILALHHGRKRTRGTGGLVAEYQGRVSRRTLQAMVAAARDEQNDDARSATRHLNWNLPHTVWASDTVKVDNPGGGQLQVQTVRDLASRYTFVPATDHVPAGAEIAAWLEGLFQEHGAPLFLKLDNAANENASEVLLVLTDWLVIPLNSPTQYPKYNGGVEHAQGEIQAEFAAILGPNPDQATGFPAYAGACVANAAHELNHRHRPILAGRCACQAFNPGRKRSMVTRRQRKEVAHYIMKNAAVILDGIDNPTVQQVRRAMRLTIEDWLASNGYVTEIERQKPELSPTSHA